MRLDIYLKQKHPELSRSQIIKDIKNGLVLVNGQKVKPSYNIHLGDKISYEPKPKKNLMNLSPSDIPLQIIYEDQNILVINKPAGLSVHPSPERPREITLINALINYYPAIKKVGEDRWRPGLVHRLDKDTSGVLVVAKNNPTFYELKYQFQNHLVKKTYLALVYGEVKESKGEIDLAIGRSKKYPLKQTIFKKRTEERKAKPAITGYKVVKRYRGFTLLEVYPQTGRTHQIRVHLAAIGHPVVGDTKYGPKKPKIKISLKRQFLHAFSITFSLANKNYTFEADLSDDLKEILKSLKD